MMDRCIEQLQRDGYGLWAAEVGASGEFIGYVGLAVPNWEATFTSCTEIVWRLAAGGWRLAAGGWRGQPGVTATRSRPQTQR
jgi:hypothetical protein